MSLRRLAVARIDLWHCHRIDPAVPRDEQFDAIAQMQKEGLIRHAGLSEVSVEEIEVAGSFFPVTTVQNRYNLIDRKSEWSRVLRGEGNRLHSLVTVGRGIAGPPGIDARRDCGPVGSLVKPGSAGLGVEALGVDTAIPGTGSTRHLEENVAGAVLRSWTRISKYSTGRAAPAAQQSKSSLNWRRRSASLTPTVARLFRSSGIIISSNHGCFASKLRCANLDAATERIEVSILRMPGQCE